MLRRSLIQILLRAIVSRAHWVLACVARAPRNNILHKGGKIQRHFSLLLLKLCNPALFLSITSRHSPPDADVLLLLTDMYALPHYASLSKTSDFLQSSYRRDVLSHHQTLRSRPRGNDGRFVPKAAVEQCVEEQKRKVCGWCLTSDTSQWRVGPTDGSAGKLMQPDHFLVQNRPSYVD